ncbi:TPA: hypothetical protein ACH3X2_003250 [Trebouxia sp. C0005]
MHVKLTQTYSHTACLVGCRQVRSRHLRRPLQVSRSALSGKWEKDKENSDLVAYENMLTLLGLRGIKKTAAVKLINGLEIDQASSPPHFTVRYVVSRMQFLQTVEHFAFDQQIEMPRRDGQDGTQTATLTDVGDGLQTVITWGEPNPVTLIENYTEVQQDTLITEAKAQAGGQTLCCKQVSTIWCC